jgi:hypothetical protein
MLLPLDTGSIFSFVPVLCHTLLLPQTLNILPDLIRLEINTQRQLLYKLCMPQF